MPRNQAPAVYEGLTPEAQEIMASASEREKEFALELAKGSTAAAAFRKCYASLNFNSQNAIWVESSRLRNDPKVSLWIRHFRLAGSALSSEGKISHAQHVTRLTELSYEAQATGNYGAAVLAETNAGKASGLYDRQEAAERAEGDTADDLAKHLGQDIADLLIAQQDRAIDAEDE